MCLFAVYAAAYRPVGLVIFVFYYKIIRCVCVIVGVYSLGVEIPFSSLWIRDIMLLNMEDGCHDLSVMLLFRYVYSDNHFFELTSHVCCFSHN